jgi:putative phosphoribosyl transferase
MALSRLFRRGNTMKYADRHDAGRRPAGKFPNLKDDRPVILALPRGGVAVGFEIARALAAPLDVVLVREIPADRDLRGSAVGHSAEGEFGLSRG